MSFFRNAACAALCMAMHAAAAAPDPAFRDMAEAKYDAASGLTTLIIKLAYGDAGYVLSTTWRGKPIEAISAHQKRSGWKEQYFFVRDDCLGGTAWRCVVDHVFTLPGEKDRKKLVYIGSVQVDEECNEQARVGCSFYKDVFTDVYDGLENNVLVSHAESPALLIEMRVNDGKFVVDLDETWGHNQERFRAGELCLGATKAERAEKCVGVTPVGALMFNAALATYTKRNEALAATKNYARAALCDAVSTGDCGEALRSFDYLIAGVEPGALAQPRGSVKAIGAPASN
jgi:hypothetical protein